MQCKNLLFCSQLHKWLSSLKLSQDYSEIMKKEAIDGSVLCMMSQSDLQSIGISAFGDRKKIEVSLNELKENANKNATTSTLNTSERQIVD